MQKVLSLTLCFVFTLTTLVSCRTSGADTIVGKWRLKSYNNIAMSSYNRLDVPDDELYLVRFNDDGQFSFSTDCNTISGQFIIDDSSITLEDMIVTEMACDQDIVEVSIKHILPTIREYQLPTDTTMLLLDQQGNALIELTK